VPASRFTNNQRRDLVQEWLAARHRETQPEFARRIGVSDRTLRSWLEQLAPDGPREDRTARRALKEAVARLQAVLAAIEAADAIDPGRQVQPILPPDGDQPSPHSAPSGIAPSATAERGRRPSVFPAPPPTETDRAKPAGSRAEVRASREEDAVWNI
jgi:hypothetical protein